MSDLDFEYQQADQLRAAIRSACIALRPYRTRQSIADKLILRQPPDNPADGFKPRLKALRDFCDGKRTTKRISSRWVNFGFEVRNLLAMNASFDDSVNKEFEKLTECLTSYIYKFNNIDVDNFFRAPSVNRSSYKFRAPKAPLELKCFAEFSDREKDIVAANPRLVGKKRFAFYLQWFDLRPDSFLILDRINQRSGIWEPIAVSIMLPLNLDVYHHILAGDIKTVSESDTGSFISGLSPFITPKGDKVNFILLDTWIVKRKTQNRMTVDSVPLPSDEPLDTAREAHHRWAGALLIKHINVLAGNEEAVPILIEPDFWHVTHLCRIFGFTPYRDEALWVAKLGNSDSDAVNRIWHAVRDAAWWDIA